MGLSLQMQFLPEDQITNVLKVIESMQKEVVAQAEAGNKKATEGNSLYSQASGFLSSIKGKKEEIIAKTAIWSYAISGIVGLFRDAMGWIDQMETKLDNQRRVMVLLGQDGTASWKEIKDTAHGLIGTAELQSALTFSSTMGITAEQFKGLERLAVSLSNELGTNAATNLDELVHKIGSGRDMFLKQMGVNVDLNTKLKEQVALHEANGQKMNEEERLQLKVQILLDSQDAMMDKFEDKTSRHNKMVEKRNAFYQFGNDILKEAYSTWSDILFAEDKSILGDVASNKTVQALQRIQEATWGASEALSFLADTVSMDAVTLEHFNKQMEQATLVGDYAISRAEQAGKKAKEKRAKGHGGYHMPAWAEEMMLEEDAQSYMASENAKAIQHIFDQAALTIEVEKRARARYRSLDAIGAMMGGASFAQAAENVKMGVSQYLDIIAQSADQQHSLLSGWGADVVTLLGVLEDSWGNIGKAGEEGAKALGDSLGAAMKLWKGFALFEAGLYFAKGWGFLADMEWIRSAQAFISSALYAKVGGQAIASAFSGGASHASNAAAAPRASLSTAQSQQPIHQSFHFNFSQPAFGNFDEGARSISDAISRQQTRGTAPYLGRG